MPDPLIQTERLSIREFGLHDAEFIVRLLNNPTWLRYIGDKNIRTINDAENYLKNGPMKSYEDIGFGLWKVELKEKQTPIGMCGLLKRDTLEYVDIGFALLPEYTQKGYAFEAATATLNYAKSNLKLEKVIAITMATNTASIQLLKRIGMSFEKKQKFGNEELLVFGN